VCTVGQSCLALVGQVGVHYELTEEEKFYRNALTRMPDGPVALEESYSAVMGIVTEVEQYVKVRHPDSIQCHGHALLDMKSMRGARVWLRAQWV
jgi:hypothetical protein